jgi:hypothetical protein
MEISLLVEHHPSISTTVSKSTMTAAVLYEVIDDVLRVQIPVRVSLDP